MVRSYIVACPPLRLCATLQKLRRPEPVLIRIVGEQQSTALDAIDQRPGDGRVEGWATPAPPQSAQGLSRGGADVRRAVHHDRAVTRAVVHAGFEAVEPQRVAVLAD